MPSTDELVKAAQAGDSSAFAELVRRYERAAIITAQASLRDFHASQDAAQEAFVVAHQKLNQLRDAASFGPWLLKIVRRRALRVQRECCSEAMTSEIADQAANPSPDWTAPYAEVIEQLARLPEHERIVTIMRYVEQRSVKDIAEVLDAPIGTITKQLSRAIERLRNWLVEV